MDVKTQCTKCELLL